MRFTLRDLDLPADQAAALSFINGSQAYERAFEPDRRVDATVAGEHFEALMAEVAAGQGRVFVAEADGRAIGWAAFVVAQAPVFVTPDQRTFGYISELYVDEPARGHGVGQALIAACEDHARALGLGHIKIGLLTANRRAADVYAKAGYAPYASELRKPL